MKSVWFKYSVVAVLALATLSGASALSVAAAERPPNIVFIFVDSRGPFQTTR